MTPAMRFVFDLIANAADKGERCPTRDQLHWALRGKGFSSVADPVSLTKALARGGYVRFYVHARNWRTAEILTGPQAGSLTRLPPRPWMAYLKIDTDTTRGEWNLGCQP